jgi:transcriptional regulator with XRE-family HTH domain
MKSDKTNTRPSRLREARIAKGLTQTDLAALTATSTSAISLYERAPVLLLPGTAKKLAAALGIAAADLLHGED